MTADDDGRSIDPREHGQRGVWLAYYLNGGACVPFATEVEALRHALSFQMKVKFARFGDADWETGGDR